ncbi:sugar phosphate isomerase/epimerase family protein [Terriglobus tenax]|uniref:sugar phosphate isomerase/epimerase family protein n=1 Tax=Terriglobus tenax TaxID=1111115 RepID=UPI0021E025EC|nr:sugar phosphate isomerase/epimerase [Terriglobus tenax]
MRLGVFNPVFAKLSLQQMLAELKLYPEITAVEVGTGGWPGSAHIDLDACLASKDAATTFRRQIQDAGLVISAFSCHGNPLHPDAAVASEADTLFRKTVRLAEMLEVPVVVTFSGCPGGGPQETKPNWITTPWPPEYSEMLAWQWEQRLIPYWQDAGAFAADHGIRVAIEAHPGFCVYNPETAMQLRATAGKSVGINLDPSHFFWQGVDLPAAIAYLGEAIFHVHAKDVALNTGNVARTGVLDAKSYTRMQERAWLFRSVGWGHGDLEWKGIASALRLAGYDYVISIEHEDALASIREGLSAAVATLSRAILREPPVEAWWV